MEETRIAVVGIIVERLDAAAAVNEILHQYSKYIIGRMGLPYRERQVNIISVVLDAPADVTSAVSGKLGRLPGVSSKALYSKQK
ncbi:iron-only hydrogenase system regulator [Clostridiaceae bacterium]|nr:iron-only hydrogenase system regulator [Clostridiaceae bacterium]RKI14153.1 iron-only hydrogenase system regulator [bacterium 1XD21-70]